jgi:carboxylesterase
MKTPLTIPGAEPFFIPGGKTGILLVHGFTGTPREMRMLAESLAQDQYTLLAPRLCAHATQAEDMNRARWWDWVASVEDGLNFLKGCTNRQVVMGLSMGGVLAMVTAARYPVEAVVSYSTPCNLPPDPRARFLSVAAPFMPRVAKGAPDWHNPEAIKDHIDYPYYPTRSILQLRQLINVMRAELPRVKVPALLFQSRQDHGIPVESMDTLYENISSADKTRVWVENSGHVIIREPDREFIFKTTKDFLKRCLKEG